MPLTKRGNQRHLGIKAHIDVDAEGLEVPRVSAEEGP